MKDTEAKAIARSLAEIARILGRIDQRQEIEHEQARMAHDASEPVAEVPSFIEAALEGRDDRELGLIDEDDAGWTRINPEEPIDPLTEFS